MFKGIRGIFTGHARRAGGVSRPKAKVKLKGGLKRFKQNLLRMRRGSNISVSVVKVKTASGNMQMVSGSGEEVQSQAMELQGKKVTFGENQVKEYKRGAISSDVERETEVQRKNLQAGKGKPGPHEAGKPPVIPEKPKYDKVKFAKKKAAAEAKKFERQLEAKAAERQEEVKEAVNRGALMDPTDFDAMFGDASEKVEESYQERDVSSRLTSTLTRTGTVNFGGMPSEVVEEVLEAAVENDLSGEEVEHVLVAVRDSEESNEEWTLNTMESTESDTSELSDSDSEWVDVMEVRETSGRRIAVDNVEKRGEITGDDIKRNVFDMNLAVKTALPNAEEFEVEGDPNALIYVDKNTGLRVEARFDAKNNAVVLTFGGEGSENEPNLRFKNRVNAARQSSTVPESFRQAAQVVKFVDTRFSHIGRNAAIVTVGEGLGGSCAKYAVDTVDSGVRRPITADVRDPVPLGSGPKKSIVKQYAEDGRESGSLKPAQLGKHVAQRVADAKKRVSVTYSKPGGKPGVGKGLKALLGRSTGVLGW